MNSESIEKHYMEGLDKRVQWSLTRAMPTKPFRKPPRR